MKRVELKERILVVLLEKDKTGLDLAEEISREKMIILITMYSAIKEPFLENVVQSNVFTEDNRP